MHRKIATAISLALYQPEILKIFVDDKCTDGFWRIIIIVHPDYMHLMKNIEEIGLTIGRFYGEGLGCTIWHNSIEFS